MFFKSKINGRKSLGDAIPSPAMYYSQVPALMPQVIEVNIPRTAIDEPRPQINSGINWKWIAIGGAAAFVLIKLLK